MSEPWCINCKFRIEGGRCQHQPLAQPHAYQVCFHSPSKFQRKEQKGGKLVVGYPVSSAPKTGIIPGRAEDFQKGYSLVCRGQRRFLVDAEGNCFSNCEKLKPLGRLKDIDKEEVPSRREMDEAIARLRQSLAKEFSNEKDIQPDVG